MFRKKISSDTLKKALEKSDFSIARKFILENEKTITNIHNGYDRFENLPIAFLDFIFITDKILEFPLSDFRSYVITCEKVQMPITNLKTSNSNTILFQCILYNKLEQISILTQSKLYSFSDWKIWGEFFESESYVEKQILLDILHIFMKNGADLNQSFANVTVLEYAFHFFSKELAKELTPYVHTLNEYNQKIYKQNRLQHLF